MLKTILVWATISLSLLVAVPTQAQEGQVVVIERTDIKRIAGEVITVRGNLMTLRHNDGSGRSAYRIPRGASISVAGTQTKLQDLQPGQNIRVYYRETSSGRVIVISPPQETETVVVIDEVDEPMEVAKVADVEVVVMPATASSVPFVGLLGWFFLALGYIIRVHRRRTV